MSARARRPETSVATQCPDGFSKPCSAIGMATVSPASKAHKSAPNQAFTLLMTRASGESTAPVQIMKRPKPRGVKPEIDHHHPELRQETNATVARQCRPVPKR